jgi:hypothetical protein
MAIERSMKRHIHTTSPFVPDIATGMSIAFSN